MTNHPIKSPRKLIEVTLPLDAINVACEKEKNPFLKGHPRAIHIWWARRPLAAARAVIFSQIVNDPAGLWEAQNPGQRPNKQQRGAFTKRRQELFKIIEDLVLWENTTNNEVQERARAEIRRSWREVCELNKGHPQAAELFNPDKPPALHDPFAGGGAIPLEAQRLGLEAYASDLNPVAVLINKAMIEIPPKFVGRPPVSLGKTIRSGDKETCRQAEMTSLQRDWPGARGLAEDVRYYGEWMRKEAQKRIGHLYPPVEITAEMAKERPDLKSLVGQKRSVIAWLWARTVKSPNPGFSHVDVPLVSTFILSNKDGKDAYVQPIVEGDHYRFTVNMSPPPPESDGGTTAGKRKGFRCLMSDSPIDYDYIRTQGKAGRIGQKLMAIVAQGERGRIFLAPTKEMEEIAAQAKPTWKPETPLHGKCRVNVSNYGLDVYGDLFTARQLLMLTTFSDLAEEASAMIKRDAINTGLVDDERTLRDGGITASAYAEAVSLYLGIAASRWADLNNSICTWNATNNCVRALFARQAIPMSWDFVELSAFGPMAGFDSILNSLEDLALALPATPAGSALQADAQNQNISSAKIISTDPPYYDNIGYADLSDFFYVWLRRSLKPIYPELLATLAAPKGEELVATPYRHSSKEKAEAFFLDGMTQAMRRLVAQAHPSFPVTIYYAFKQSETSVDSGTVSTGWVTFLDAVLRSGFQLTGTWPMRTEREARSVGLGANALASSIVLVCRKRPADAPTISRREFIRELNGVLPEALDEMTKGSGEERSPVAPVDLSQAIIGPGMAVFSKYAAVLEADGSPMSVRTALQLINRFLAEDDFDADTQFCLHWFEQHGWTESVFGEADVLARSKSTSVDAMKEAGVLQSGSGKVRLLKWAEYPTDWDPRKDTRTPVWEALHQLIRALKQGGESASGALLAALGGKAEAVRQLAYRLYTLCERLGQAEDARAYNELITSWTGIETAASTAPKPTDGLLPGFE